LFVGMSLVARRSGVALDHCCVGAEALGEVMGPNSTFDGTTLRFHDRNTGSLNAGASITGI
jgi:hypothetical protein